MVDKNGKQAEPHYFPSKIFYIKNNVDNVEDEAERALEIDPNLRNAREKIE